MSDNQAEYNRLNTICAAVVLAALKAGATTEEACSFSMGSAAMATMHKLWAEMTDTTSAGTK